MKEETKRLRDLTRTVLRESILVRELEGALLRQRGGVATSDLEAVRAATGEAESTLVKLDKTRALRRRIVTALSGKDAAPLTALERALPVQLPPDFFEARTELVRAAESVAQQVAINHEVFRRAVEAGETFLQTVFAYVGQETSLYHPPADTPRCSESSAVFVNKVG